AKELRARGSYRGVYGPTPLRGGVQVLVKGGEDLPTLLARDLKEIFSERRLGRVKVEVDVDPIEIY
ncbi:MAG: hypothetical protein HYS14_10450, partial [Candidatus Rokubacteria bacterium]|nr:hypothetical protein [Candidatus Rokubacteria bacterium]